ncbi:hypothetical protein [Streptomyces sp. MMG1121]|uniref:hypothetical protein n=1 Tax=Streptomyces sp. MMG1121 TaxID=1415544 RepID=UPI0006AFA74E|nr:hypothetical protein [Streptomyces sp. MMG1121]KOV61873.1 hypothetical protein ADK64_25800 [Streptomyces sp. MMG1121]
MEGGHAPGGAGRTGRAGYGGCPRAAHPTRSSGSWARFGDPAPHGIVPVLGRRDRHGTGKAERLLDRRPRPAGQTALDCAEGLLAHGAVPVRAAQRQ